MQSTTPRSVGREVSQKARTSRKSAKLSALPLSYSGMVVRAAGRIRTFNLFLTMESFVGLCRWVRALFPFVLNLSERCPCKSQKRGQTFLCATIARHASCRLRRESNPLIRVCKLSSLGTGIYALESRLTKHSMRAYRQVARVVSIDDVIVELAEGDSEIAGQ